MLAPALLPSDASLPLLLVAVQCLRGIPSVWMGTWWSSPTSSGEDGCTCVHERSESRHVSAFTSTANAISAAAVLWNNHSLVKTYVYVCVPTVLTCAAERAWPHQQCWSHEEQLWVLHSCAFLSTVRPTAGSGPFAVDDPAFDCYVAAGKA
jgi:hypothetical protein